MANKLYEETDIQATADAIRERNGLTSTYKVSEFADAIRAIPTGGDGSGLKVYRTSVTLDEKASEIPVTHNLRSTDILLAAAYLDEDCVDLLEKNDAISSVFIASAFNAPYTSNGTKYQNIRHCRYWYVSSSGNGSQSTSSMPSNEPIITDENSMTIKSGTNSYVFPAGVKIGILVVAV